MECFVFVRGNFLKKKELFTMIIIQLSIKTLFVANI